MRRKLIQHGPHSLGISLPTQWLRDHELIKGNEVGVHEHEDGLLVCAQTHDKEQEIELDISQYNNSYLTKRLLQLYEDGYTTITFLFSKPTVLSPSQQKPVDLKQRLEYLVGRLVGLEIVSWHANSVTMKFLFSSATLSIDEIKSKTLNLIKHYVNNLNEALKTNDQSLLEIGQELHDTIAKFISLAKREIRLSRANRAEYILFVLLDKVADYLRHVYANIKEENISSSTKESLKLINEVYLLFDEGYRKKNAQMLNEVLIKRAQTYETILTKKNVQAPAYMYAGMLELIILMVENTTIS